MHTYEQYMLEKEVDALILEFNKMIVDREKVNEELDPVTIAFGLAGALVALPKLIEGIGWICKKVHNLFVKKSKKIEKSKLEKIGEKMHHKIIHAMAKAIGKLFKLEEDKAETAANIVYWGILIVLGTFSGVGAVKGFVTGAHGVVIPLVESILTAIKSYELVLVVIGVVAFIKIGADAFENKIGNAVEMAEICVEDSGVSKKGKKMAAAINQKKIFMCIDEKAKKKALKKEAGVQAQH